jgi:hypothetical protein
MTQFSPSHFVDVAAQSEIDQMEIRLQRQLQSIVWEFSLSLFKDGLMLRGHTSSYYGKQLAQHAVMRMTDMPIRSNEILVNYR